MCRDIMEYLMLKKEELILELGVFLYILTCLLNVQVESKLYRKGEKEEKLMLTK